MRGCSDDVGVSCGGIRTSTTICRFNLRARAAGYFRLFTDVLEGSTFRFYFLYSSRFGHQPLARKSTHFQTTTQSLREVIREDEALITGFRDCQ